MSRERKIQKKKEWEQWCIQQENERHRKASLSLFDRIEECVTDDDLKDILHRIASGERE